MLNHAIWARNRLLQKSTCDVKHIKTPSKIERTNFEANHSHFKDTEYQTVILYYLILVFRDIQLHRAALEDTNQARR